MRVILIRLSAYLSIIKDIEFDEEAIPFHIYFVVFYMKYFRFSINYPMDLVNTDFNLMVKLFPILFKLR